VRVGDRAAPRRAGDPRSDPRRAFLLALGLVAMLGFGARLGLAVEVRDHHAFGYDATWYHVVANHVSRGDGFVVDGRNVVGGFPLTPWPEARPTAFFPPAYPAALAVGSLLGLRTLFEHQAWSALLGTATVVLAGFLGRRLAGSRAGIVAATAVAVHPLMIGADVALMSESLYGAVVVALVLAVYRALDRPTAARWALVGVAGGAAALTRNEGIALALLAVAVGILATRGPWRVRARLGGIAVCALALMVVPWMVRNAVRVDSFTVSTNAGATVAGANCPSTYSGSRIGSWDFACLDMARWQHDRAPEADFYGDLLHQGLDYARHHPSRWPAVTAARIGRVTSLYQPVQELRFAQDEGRHRPVQLAGTAAYYLVLGGAIGGFVLLRRRRVELGPVLAPVVTVLLAALLHGNPRIRFAAEPTLIVGAAVAVVAVHDRLFGARWRRGSAQSR
jgi:4-amino-4-deoxy-L-arabinose transferase-like glycosyltransferase